MKRNTIFSVLVLFLAVLGLIFFVYKPSFNKSAIPTPLDRITGKIVAMKDDNITILSTVQSLKNKNIDVVVTPATAITKVVYITPKNVKSGESYIPETKRIPIAMNDLSLGMTIYLQTKENLLISDKVTALNIVYETFDQQK